MRGFRVALACAALLVGCKSNQTAGGKPRVAVSIFPLHDVARRIAGDRLDVLLILPPGRSEHGYEPTPQEMGKVAQARLGVFVGLGMDEWAEKLVEGASSGAEHVDLAEACDPKPYAQEHVGEAEEAEGEHHEHEHEHEHDKGAMDPHFWLDPQRMQKGVDVLVAAFSKLDPAGAEGFAARGAEVKRSLAAVDEEIATRAKSWNKKTIVTFHGSMRYFADRYGLKVAAVIEPFPGREPTAKYMSEVLAAIKQSGAAALFSEPQLDKAPAKVVADQSGLPLFELDPVGGGAGAESYEALLRKNAAVLDQALR